MSRYFKFFVKKSTNRHFSWLGCETNNGSLMLKCDSWRNIKQFFLSESLTIFKKIFG